MNRGEDAVGKDSAPHRLDDAFFRSLFESNIAGLAVADLGSRTIVEINQRLLQILGRTREEVVDLPDVWMEFTPPEYQHLDISAMQVIMAGGRAEPFTKEYERPDGSRIPVRVSTSLVYGHPGKVIVAVADLTEEKRRERENRHNNEQLLTLADSLPALISYIDRDLRYQFVNKPYEDWFGRPRREIVGRSVRDFITDNDLAIREQAFAGVLAGEPQRFEAQTPHSDGTSRLTEMQYVPRFGTDGQVTGFYVLVSDISARKAAEEELRRAAEAARESEARFRAMAEAAPVMIWQSGPDGQSEYLNRGYLAFFGKTDEEVLGFGWVPAEHPEDKDANLQEYMAAVREQRRFEVEARFLNGDGQYRILHSVGVPRFDAAGIFLGHIGVSRDVTEEREAETKQKLLIDELNHRVKNTLAVVQSLAWQTLRNANVPPGLRQAFEQRLMALATAHDVLTRKNWNPASIEAIFRSGVGALGIADDRVTIKGPLLRVPPKTAVSLAMAVHELATNALKYGSLSVPEGSVELMWNVNEGSFSLTWQERGGPPVAAPQTRGFGSRLIERGLSAELSGDARIEFQPDGITCTISAPLPAGAYAVV